MKRIAIIPARGDSKRIPGKNIRLFCGRPIIEYSIDTARKSGLFDLIMVSTDSPKIAKVAVTAGAQVPFLRSAGTAGDFVPIASAVYEAVLELEHRNQSYDVVCCLFATAPFTTSKWLRDSLKILEQKGCDTVVPVKESPGPLFRSLTLNRDGMLQMIWPAQHHTRSQDLDRTFHDAGQFYWAKTSALKDRQVFYSDRACCFELDYLDCIDIDTEDNWRAAEDLYKFHKTSRTLDD